MPKLHITVDRGEVEPGKTFSRDAMQATLKQVDQFILGTVMKRWEQTQEPPTHLDIQVEVTVG